jgi:acyl-CoA synthetase (AMP-forming)/AMP-acid ligase II
MGDVGYLDELGRFWYCGRKSQRVVSGEGALYTECVEQVATGHPFVRRAALVRYTSASEPVLVLELESSSSGVKQTLADLRAVFPEVKHLLEYIGPLPTDIRHNAKINREKLAEWAAKKLKNKT